MKRQFFFVSTIILMVVLSACGSQPTQTPLEPATQPEAPVQPAQLPTTTSIAEATATNPPVSDPVTEAPAAEVSFAKDVLPIFNDSCNKCHGLEQVKEGLNMTSYETLIAGSINGTVITPGNSDDSFLVQQVVEGEMPKRGPKLTVEQIQAIADWINAGALNN